MAESRIVVGLDIGSSKACMAVAEIFANGKKQILGVDEIVYAADEDIVEKGEIKNNSLLTDYLRVLLERSKENTNVDILHVYVSLSGSHIKSVFKQGSYRLPDDVSIVTSEHLEIANENLAQEIAESFKSEEFYPLQQIKSPPIVDDRINRNPVQMAGRVIDMHASVLYGVKSRMSNTLLVVRNVPLFVDDVAFSAFCSSQTVFDLLDSSQNPYNGSESVKDEGLLVIDLGAGVSDYVMYLNCHLVSAGCLPLGGANVTRDIAGLLSLGSKQAEQLKIEHGSLSAGQNDAIGSIDVDGVRIARAQLNRIIRERYIDILQRLYTKISPQFVSQAKRVVLVGGASLMPGIAELVAEVFKINPANIDACSKEHVAKNKSEGNYMSNPAYFCVLGLIGYAAMRQPFDNKKSGWQSMFGGLKRLFKKAVSLKSAKSSTTI